MYWDLVDFVYFCEYYEYIIKYNCVLCIMCSIEQDIWKYVD